MVSFSIIICTFNGRNSIIQVLENLISLEFNNDICFEVIVVDNNSTDETNELVKSFILNGSHQNIKLIKELKAGKGYAFWTGVLNSNFDNIIICDDDNLLDRLYLKIASDQINCNPNYGAIGGLGIPIIKTEVPIWFEFFKSNFATGSQAKSAISAELFGAGMIINRHALSKLLPFRESLFLLQGRSGNRLLSGEDTELTKILSFLGYDIIYSKNLLFWHIISSRKLNFKYLNSMFFGFGATYPYLYIYDLILRNTKFPRLEIFRLVLFSIIKLPYYFLFPPIKFGRWPYVNWCLGNFSSIWNLRFSLFKVFKTQSEILHKIKF
jgi:glycosyltransferase involved in cell wall biosynthesis